jgi:hypothetical protein
MDGGTRKEVALELKKTHFNLGHDGGNYLNILSSSSRFWKEI